MPEFRTEAEAIAHLAEIGAEPVWLPAQPGDVGHLVVPTGNGVHDVDLERLLPSPRRAKGHTHVHDAGSLILYVRKHGSIGPAVDGDGITGAQRAAELSPTGLYADVDTVTVTAVINGHGNGPERPGWGDHRASLKLRLAPEWAFWTGNDRKWLSQTDFAEHLDEGYGEIVDPSAADMLELAQTMQAYNRVEWKSQQLVANGQRQFIYREQIDATGGSTGTLTIPTRFTLGLVVFDGQTEGYKVEARFQFRLAEGTLRVRYLLVRPHDIVRSAFGDVVTEIEDGTGLVAFRGTPIGA